jgi:transposase
MFVPAVIEAAVAEPQPARQSAKHRRRARRASSGSSDGIEFEIDGVVVRIGSGASPKAIAAVIGALKGRS